MEETLTLVTILVTTPCPHDEERIEYTWHKLYDLAPNFPATHQAIESYSEVEGVQIQVWHKDPEDEPKISANHPGSMAIC